jgi:hypothetical protein
VLVEEHLDLGSRRLVDDVLGGGRGKGRHRRSIPSRSARSNVPASRQEGGQPGQRAVPVGGESGQVRTARP